jgi:hypothetical protein
VRRHSFQEFNYIDGETIFESIVELDQANDPTLAPNGYQGDRSVALMYAIVARMKSGILIGRKVQKRERIVGPAAPPWCEERIGRISLAGKDQTTGTFQAGADVLVPAYSAIRGTLDERVFRQQKIFGKSLLGKIREVIPLL